MKVLKYVFLLVFFSQNLWGYGKKNTLTDPVEPQISLSANPMQFNIASSGDTCDLDIVCNINGKILHKDALEAIISAGNKK